MANSLNGLYFIDGYDLFLSYSLFIESGTDGFLQYPARKDSITHDWPNYNGKDVDTTQVFVQSRTITLQCAIVVRAATAAEDFRTKYNAFLALLLKPGTRTFSAVRLGATSYSVIYRDANNFKMFTPLKNNPELVACKFSLILEELEPKIDATVTAIVDDDNRILIT